MRDEGDNHVAELAVAGGASMIVTNNRADFAGSDLRFPAPANPQPQRQELATVVLREGGAGSGWNDVRGHGQSSIGVGSVRSLRVPPAMEAGINTSSNSCRGRTWISLSSQPSVSCVKCDRLSSACRRQPTKGNNILDIP